MRRETSREKEPGGLLSASGLVERLIYIRKRKRAFGGQTVDMEALRRRLEAERRRTRGR
jgi:hypothetical protein